MKFAPSIAENLAQIDQAAHEAADRRSDVILFPECATTGYACDFAKIEPRELELVLDEVAGTAERTGINILIGSAVHRQGRLQNCLVAFDRRGREVGLYAKCQLTDGDRKYFRPGNSIALFKLDGILSTAIICHERRYPELVRLGVMAGAQVIFHPNAGMDDLSVSRQKRGGRDGIAVRAFENAAFYVFANSVGPQGGGKWSAGDSKIVAPDGKVLKLANNKDADVIVADLDLSLATRKYALESLQHPSFLSSFWKKMLKAAQQQRSR